MTSPILKPLITEKSMRDAARSVYTFLVAKGATKSVVATSVAAAFRVNVLGVTTTTRHLASRRVGRLRRLKPQTPEKIARVQLKPGEKIALFESKKD